MDFVKAKKGTQTKTFPKVAWDLLPKDKKGWVEVVGDEPVIAPIAPPPSGEEKKSPTNQKVTSDAKKQESAVVNADAEKKSEEVSTSNEDVEKFNELVAGIKTNQIKDFLDLNEVKYGKKDSVVEKLREFLNGDVEKLKTEFSL